MKKFTVFLIYCALIIPIIAHAQTDAPWGKGQPDNATCRQLIQYAHQDPNNAGIAIISYLIVRFSELDAVTVDGQGPLSNDLNNRLSIFEGQLGAICMLQPNTTLETATLVIYEFDRISIYGRL